MSAPRPDFCARCSSSELEDVRIEQVEPRKTTVLLESGWLCVDCKLLFAGDTWYDYAEGGRGLKEAW